VALRVYSRILFSGSVRDNGSDLYADVPEDRTWVLRHVTWGPANGDPYDWLTYAFFLDARIDQTNVGQLTIPILQGMQLRNQRPSEWEGRLVLPPLSRLIATNIMGSQNGEHDIVFLCSGYELIG
jgi:hypothetical protein